MRVVGGIARGRSLKAKLPTSVRPTTDMAREAIFSMIESRGGLVGLTVADLYCGSGAMGIEALSRGAARVYFVDSESSCLDAARTNLASVQLEGDVHFVRATLPRWTAPSPVDLVLADPPYGDLDVVALLATCDASRAVVENDRYAEAPDGWQVTKQKRYGTTLVTMLDATRDLP
jgi:16S rRNA (guanine966-N2)-methyltransferase